MPSKDSLANGAINVMNVHIHSPINNKNKTDVSGERARQSEREEAQKHLISIQLSEQKTMIVIETDSQIATQHCEQRNKMKNKKQTQNNNTEQWVGKRDRHIGE